MQNLLTAKSAPAFLNNDYDTEQQQILRNRKYAEILQQQAMTPDNPNQVVDGRVVRYSPMQGLAKLLQGYSSGRANQIADEQQSALGQRKQQDFMETAKAYAQALRGRPEISLPEDQAGPVSPAIPPNPQAANDVLLQSKSPMWQALGMQSMMPSKYGNTPHYDQGGRAYVLNEQGQVKYLDGVKARDKMEVSKAGQVYNPYDVQPGQVMPDPNKPFSLGPNGQPVPNTGYQNYELGKARAGASTVSVNTAQKPFLNELGKGAGEAVTNAFNQAQQAQGTLANVQQIRSGLKNIMSGPGANISIGLAQLGEVLGINGASTTEKLQNTRNVIQGLARQELSAAGLMKGQGQITESERGILKRAESGDIASITVPELKTLLGALEKTANYRIGVHNQNLDKLRKDPNAAPMVEYMTLPNMQPQGGSSSGFKIIGTE